MLEKEGGTIGVVSASLEPSNSKNDVKKVNGHFVMKSDTCQDIQDIICSRTVCESECSTCLVSDSNHPALLELLQSIFKYK